MNPVVWLLKWCLRGSAVIAILGLGVGLLSPALFNIQYIIVLSGSMEPYLPVGSMAVMQPIDPADVVVGDPITFGVPEYPGVLVTHRVVEILRAQDGSPRFRTKGDANEEADSFLVIPQLVKGKVVFDIPYLGYSQALLRSRNSFFLLILLSGVVIVTNEVWAFVRSMDPRQRALERRRQRRAR